MMKKVILGLGFMLLAFGAFSQINKTDAAMVLTRFPNNTPKSAMVGMVNGTATIIDIPEKYLVGVVPAATGLSITYTATNGGVNEFFVAYSSIVALGATNGSHLSVNIAP